MATNSENLNDEFAIDYSKIDELKLNQQLILDLFQVSIVYDDATVKPQVNSQTKDRKQWISLFGSKEKRQQTKEFINSICHPESVKQIQISEKYFQSSEFKKLNEELIRKNRVFLQTSNISNSDCNLEIKGRPFSVTLSYSLILQDFAEFESKINEKSPKNDEDDDCIVLNDDPYEILDKPAKPPPIQSLPKLPPSIKDLLIDKGKSNGYTIDEIQNAFQHFGSYNIGNNEYMNFLKSNRKSNQSLINLNKLKVATTSDTTSTELNNQLMKSSSDECEVIAYKPAGSSILTNTKKEEALEDYAQLLQKHDPNGVEFNKNLENKNKEKRITTLISAMDNDQQSQAIYQFNQYKNTPKNPTPPPPAMPKSTPQPLIAIPPLLTPFNASSKQPYNSNLYQTPKVNETNFNFLSSQFNQVNKEKKDDGNKILFTNFKQDDILNAFKASTTQPQLHNSSSTTNIDLNQKNKKRSKSTQGRPANNVTTINNNNAAHGVNLNKNLRPIYIDGSNVAREHGKRTNTYSCKGIQLSVDYFLKRGHDKVEAFVPRFRRGNSDKDIPTTNGEILDDLERKGILKYTPSRSYDDRFILHAACHHDGVIVSNDQYRDLLSEEADWKVKIPNKLLPYVFSEDLFMPAQDPFGRNGPKLNEILSFPSKENKMPNQKNNKKNENISTSLASNQTRFDDFIQQAKFNNNNNNSQFSNFPTVIINKPHQRNQPQPPQIKTNSILSSNPYQALDVDMNTASSSSTNENKVIFKRNVAQTSEICATLMGIFPNLEKEITRLLNNYPDVFDVDFFSNMLIDHF